MKDHAQETPPPEDSWANWLTVGESLLWHGRPVPGFRVRFADVFNTWPLLIFGIFATFFPAWWLARFLPDPPNDFGEFLPFWMQAHVLFFVAFNIAMAVIRNKRQSAAYYSLTNLRAVVGYSWPWRSSREYRLPSLAPGLLQDEVYVSRSKPRSLYFRRHYTAGSAFQFPRYRGFDYLSQEDAKEVYAHLKRLHVPINQNLV